MKTKLFVKAILIAITISLVSGYSAYGQHLRQDVRVTIDGLDFGPGVGKVYGDYVIRYTFYLNNDGYLENIHWNVIEKDMVNESGIKVNIVDTGHDNLGFFWDIWNNINAWNYGYPIYYDVEDGWLNDYLPPALPSEGSYVNMSCKLICRGTVVKMPMMVQIHRNASGEIVAEVYK